MARPAGRDLVRLSPIQSFAPGACTRRFAPTSDSPKRADCSNVLLRRPGSPPKSCLRACPRTVGINLKKWVRHPIGERERAIHPFGMARIQGNTAPRALRDPCAPVARRAVVRRVTTSLAHTLQASDYAVVAEALRTRSRIKTLFPETFKRSPRASRSSTGRQ
jgi:hypothetical protein